MSATRLQELLRLVEETDLGPWLREGVNRWEAGEPLDRALELTGGRAVRLRDAALRDAAELLDPKGTASHWERAGLLSSRIESFERIYSRYKDQPDAFQHGVNASLAAAFRLGCVIPRSQRGLWNVLKKYSEDFKKAG